MHPQDPPDGQRPDPAVARDDGGGSPWHSSPRQRKLPLDTAIPLDPERDRTGGLRHGQLGGDTRSSEQVIRQRLIDSGAVDEKLNEKGYIVPGLGDAGDRLFGTK